MSKRKKKSKQKNKRRRRTLGSHAQKCTRSLLPAPGAAGGDDAARDEGGGATITASYQRHSPSRASTRSPGWSAARHASSATRPAWRGSVGLRGAGGGGGGGGGAPPSAAPPAQARAFTRPYHTALPLRMERSVASASSRAAYVLRNADDANERNAEEMSKQQK